MIYRISQRINTTNVGLYHMLFAAFCISIAGACSKVLSRGMSPMEVVFLRNIFGVIYVSGLIYRKPLVNKGGRGGLLFFRGFLGALAILANFCTIIHIGLAEAITYQQSYPIFLTLISVYFLKVSISRHEWLAVVIGFLGICFIFSPNLHIGSGSVTSHCIGIANSIIAALAYLSIAELSKFYENRTIILVFMSTGVLMPTLFMLAGYVFNLTTPTFLFAPLVMPVGIEWFFIAALGLSALLGKSILQRHFLLAKRVKYRRLGTVRLFFLFFSVC